MEEAHEVSGTDEKLDAPPVAVETKLKLPSHKEGSKKKIKEVILRSVADPTRQAVHLSTDSLGKLGDVSSRGIIWSETCWRLASWTLSVLRSICASETDQLPSENFSTTSCYENTTLYFSCSTKEVYDTFPYLDQYTDYLKLNVPWPIAYTLE